MISVYVYLLRNLSQPLIAQTIYLRDLKFGVLVVCLIPYLSLKTKINIILFLSQLQGTKFVIKITRISLLKISKQCVFYYYYFMSGIKSLNWKAHKLLPEDI